MMDRALKELWVEALLMNQAAAQLRVCAQYRSIYLPPAGVHAYIDCFGTDGFWFDGDGEVTLGLLFAALYAEDEDEALEH